MKQYDYVTLKAAQITLRNAAERKESWWKNFARYAEIAKRKLWFIEVSLLACLILSIGGCAKVMEGTGRIIEGVGDGVVAGGVHLQESSSSH